MPYNDIQTAKEVWLKTIDIVSKGNIVKSVNEGKRKTNFSGKKFNKIAQVRPYANHSNHTFPLPIKDKVTQTNDYTKYSFG